MHSIRRNIPGVVYHLIWRFVDKRYFITGHHERRVYLELLGKALEYTDWRCLAFAVMSNHIHLAMVAGRGLMAGWTRRVNSPFATYMNARVQRIGPVFAQGAKDYAVSSAGEAGLLTYIHRNPVRAKLVSRASESAWTSHRMFIGRTKRPPWLHVDEALARIGMTPSEFGRWVDREEGDSGTVETDQLSAQLRKRGALRVATPSKLLRPIVARSTAYWRPDPRLIVQLASVVSGVAAPLICSKRRIDEAMSARRAIVFAAIEHGITLSEVADSLGLSRQAAAKMSMRKLSGVEARWLEEIRERADLEAGGASWVRPGQRLLFRAVTDR